MTEKKQNGMIAVIRIRGAVDARHDLKKTFSLLRLYRRHFCVVLDNTDANKGMIDKIKDYITWGEIDDVTFKELIDKRGEEYLGRLSDTKDKIKYDNKYLQVGNKKYKKYFRLNAPRKGFERKGIKMPFSKGGALGNRGEKMKELIARMI